MRRRLLVVFAAMAVLFTLSGPFAASADPSATAPEGDVGALAWDCVGGSAPSAEDSGGRDVWSRCTRHTGEWVGGTFYAYGEILRLCDHFPNGYSTFAILDVAGYSSRTFYSKGKAPSCTTFNLDYPEGRHVFLTVCTSNQDGARCKTSDNGRT